MLKSMTGYGEATVQTRSFVFGVEIRSVNNKFLKITTKIPEEISYLQHEIEEPIRKIVQRGSIYLTVRFEPASNVDLYEVDEGVLKKYQKTLNVLAAELQTGEEILIKDLLVLPGVIRAETALPLAKEELLPVALETMEKALAQVVAMRAREGTALEAEFCNHARTLGVTLAEVRKAHPAALKDHHERLRERVNQLLSGTELSLSSEDLLREVAVLAERADIAEEIARLESHLGQFGETLHSDQPVGRKLEFILQEMVRELNTMGSKATDSPLQRLILDMKADVSRLREQACNVE
jgi:uncharacterized protein (TIGR00255 family)